MDIGVKSILHQLQQQLNAHKDFKEVTVYSERKHCHLWKDKRLVYVTSTNSNSFTTKDGTIITVKTPTHTRVYNKFMGGVDQTDKLRSYYYCKIVGHDKEHEVNLNKH